MPRSRLSFALLMALPLLYTASADAAPPTQAGATTEAQAAAAPAGERTATRIPEPDTIALFLMGASGLFVGRRLSRTGRRGAPDA